MEPFIKEQIQAVLKYVPFHICASFFKKQNSAEVDAAKGKLGGFMKGICHPSDNYAQIRGAGIGWNRADLPFPFDDDGNVTQDYINWKARMQAYKDNGIRIMAVTPYPRDYISHNADPRTPEGEARVKEIARFFIKDLQGLVEVFQITNEMAIPHFTLPLTTKEGARFIGVQAEAMYPLRKNVLIGYNSSGPQGDLHAYMRPWLKYCDYVGIDLYVGCFAPVGNSLSTIDMMLRYIWSMTKKPIILAEFGYISDGAPKSPEQKRAILEQYGVSSEKELREKIDTVLENMKEIAPNLYNNTIHCSSSPERRADYLLQIDIKNHLYRQLPKRVVVKKYPHTFEGHAGFYRDLLPRLVKHPFLLGAFIYCWKDGDRCYICGQSDCPIETRWGIIDQQNKEKPSYYAVRDAFAKIK